MMTKEFSPLAPLPKEFVKFVRAAVASFQGQSAPEQLASINMVLQIAITRDPSRVVILPVRRETPS